VARRLSAHTSRFGQNLRRAKTNVWPETSDSISLIVTACSSMLDSIWQSNGVKCLPDPKLFEDK
jgi:hypothetical protein